MEIKKFRPEDVDKMFRLIHDSGRIIQVRAAYIDSHLVTLQEVKELLRHPRFDPDGVFFAYSAAADAAAKAGLYSDHMPVGFTMATCSGEKAMLHFFIVKRQHFDGAALLLECVLDWARSEGAAEIEQGRLDWNPLSGAMDDVFRVEEDEHYVELFRSKGFDVNSLKAGNMIIDLETFQEMPEIKDLEKKLTGEGIHFRTAAKSDMDKVLAVARSGDANVLVSEAFKERPESIEVALHEGKVIGYSTFFAWTLSEPLPEYGPVLVLPDYRRRHIGTVLLYRSIKYTRQLGKQSVRLSCSGIPLFHYYGKVGFEQTEKWYRHVRKKLV